MRSVRNIVIFSLSLVIGLQVSAQKRPKYDEELPKILQLPNAGKVALLKVYRIEEPEEASIDLHLGVVYNNRFLESDILTQYKYKYGNAVAAINSLKIANLRIDEKEVKRNKDQYFPFGFVDAKGKVDVEYDTIKNYIDSSVPVLEEFIKRAPGIYSVFTQSFARYDAAHKEFSKIVGQYTTEKDLLLLYNSNLDKQMEAVKKAYLEAVQLFNQYKDSISTYPIGYTQELMVKEMKVYRLDGLESEINFLTPEVSVWDYAKWVDETRQYIKDNIDQLKTDLASENLRIDKAISSAAPDYAREDFTPLEIDKEVLFTLRKYDLNSVIEPLFLYKEAKHDLLYQKLLSKDLDTSTVIEDDRKLYLYGQMLNKIKEADSVLVDVTARNQEISLEKYNSFLTQNYQGIEGINSLVSSERNNNSTDYGKYVESIRDIVFEKVRIDTSAVEVDYKKKKIPFIASEPVDFEVLTSEHITTHKIINFDGSAFIGGILKNETEEKIQAFIAGVTKEGKVGWYRDFMLQIDSAGFDAHTRLATMQTVPGGISFILNGYNQESGDRINHMMILDETGEELLSKRMLFLDYPRTMNYNERENSLLVSFKGEDYLKDIFLSNELIIANYNILGDLTWQQRREYKGDVTSVFSISEGYMVVGNFNSIKDIDGKIISAGSSNTDTRGFVIRIDNAGNIEAIRSLNSPRSFQIEEIYKVSDDCINLLGNEGSYIPRSQYTPGDNYIHLIINKELQTLSSNIN